MPLSWDFRHPNDDDEQQPHKGLAPSPSIFAPNFAIELEDSAGFIELEDGSGLIVLEDAP